MKGLSGKIVILLIIALAAKPGIGTAQEERPVIEVSASVDTAVITIGDIITYSIMIDHITGMRVEQPGAGINLGQFEIKDYSIHEPRSDDGRTRLKYEYRISVFDTGTFTIPPYPVAYFPDDTTTQFKLIEANPIQIYVRSLLDAEGNELRDIKPPIDIPYNYTRLILIITAVLLVLAAVFMTLRIYRRRKEQGYLIKPPPPPRPAHETALEALEALRQKDLLEQGEVKLYYIELTDIIRRYLEDRYFIPALEETSREILNDMAGQNISGELTGMLTDVLELSDLVKFARLIPAREDGDRAMQQAETFIQQTKLVFEAETEKPAAQAVA